VLRKAAAERLEQFLVVAADRAEQLRADGIVDLPGDALAGPAGSHGQGGDRVLVLGVLQQPARRGPSPTPQRADRYRHGNVEGEAGNPGGLPCEVTHPVEGIPERVVRPQLLHVFIDAADMVLGVGDVALQDPPVRPGGGDGDMSLEPVDNCGLGVTDIAQRRYEQIRGLCHHVSPGWSGEYEAAAISGPGREPALDRPPDHASWMASCASSVHPPQTARRERDRRHRLPALGRPRT
jgi:hypothetical protein